MQTTDLTITRRSAVILSVITSLVISAVIIGAMWLFVYNKYLKTDKLQKFVNNYLEGYVESGDLYVLLVEKLEQFTGGEVAIGEVSIDDKHGIRIRNMELLIGDAAITVKDASATVTGGIVLNEIVRSGKSDADTITINSATIDLDSITLKTVAVNPSSPASVQHPKLSVEKLVLAYSVLDVMNGKFMLKGAVATSPELSLVRREHGVWLIMDALKKLVDNANLSDYAGLMSEGIKIDDGILHFIGKGFFVGDVLDVSGINLTLRPSAGQLSRLVLDGAVHDDFLGDYDLDGRLDLDVPRLKVSVRSPDFILSEALVRNVPVIGESFWGNYKPNGRVGLDCRFTFDNRGGARQIDRKIDIVAKDLEVTYHKWPITTSRIAGNMLIANNMITISNANGYVFHDGQNGTDVKLDLVLEIGKPTKKIVVRASDIDLTRELVKKMPDSCMKLYETFKPIGRGDIDIIYTVDDDGGAVTSNYMVEVVCKDWKLRHNAIPVPVSGVDGRIVVDNRGTVGQLGKCAGSIRLKDFRGTLSDGSNNTAFSLSGEFDMGSPKKIINVDVPGLSLSSSLLQYLPKEYETLKNDFTPDGMVDLRIAYGQDAGESKPNLQASIYCKGCNIKDVKLPMPISGVMGVVNVTGNRVSAENITGMCYGGLVNGSMEMDIDGHAYNYSGKFNFSEMDMEELFKNAFKTDQEWVGMLNGNIEFNRSGNGRFNAFGTIIMDEGDISDVPLALSIINILNFGLPTKVIFHNAHVRFRIVDNVIEIEEARIYSDTIELVARGQMDFGGNLDVDVIVGFNKSVLRDIPVVGSLVDLVVGGVRKQLTKVHVGGTISEPESHLAMLTPIKRPIKSAIELIPEKTAHYGTTTTKTIPGDRKKN